MKVGIIGGGQLAMMTIQEGLRMGMDFAVLSDTQDVPASYFTKNIYTKDRIEEFMAFSDVITYEFEHIDREIFENHKLLDKLYPGVKPIELKQNRLKEKIFLARNNFSTMPFYEAQSGMEAFEIANDLNKELVIKKVSQGYDGKGQYAVHTKDDLERLKDVFISSKDTFLIEEFCYFDFEMSVIAGISNEQVVFLPMTRNVHKNGILLYNHIDKFSIDIQEKTKAITTRLLKALDIKKGVLAVEFFVKAKDIYINEFAPRVHNTGHHTLDDMELSQFELLLRTLFELPIYSPQAISEGGMVNIIGDINLTKELMGSILQLEGTKFYWYRKTPKENRKIGHINITAKDLESLKAKIRYISKTLYPNINVW